MHWEVVVSDRPVDASSMLRASTGNQRIGYQKCVTQEISAIIDNVYLLVTSNEPFFIMLPDDSSDNTMSTARDWVRMPPRAEPIPVRVGEASILEAWQRR